MNYFPLQIDSQEFICFFFSEMLQFQVLTRHGWWYNTSTGWMILNGQFGPTVDFRACCGAPGNPRWKVASCAEPTGILTVTSPGTSHWFWRTCSRTTSGVNYPTTEKVSYWSEWALSCSSCFITCFISITCLYPIHNMRSSYILRHILIHNIS